MSKIVNINGKNFLNDYIDFRVKDYGSYNRHDLRNYPESRCLVHIWQNSNNLLDFWDNMVSAHNHWLKQNPNTKKPLTTAGYINRVSHMRKSGVNLKRYEDEGTTIQKALEVAELRKISKITVT